MAINYDAEIKRRGLSTPVKREEKKEEKKPGLLSRFVGSIKSGIQSIQKEGEAKNAQFYGAKTPEEQTARENRFGMRGNEAMQKQNLADVQYANRKLTYDEILAKRTREEQMAERDAKFLTAPIRYTAGSLASGLVSLGLEKANSDLQYTPKTDIEKLLIGDQKIQRITKDESLYGVLARGAGTTTAVIAMAALENPFLQGTGVSTGIKNVLKRKLEKEGAEYLAKLGSKEFIKLADEAIKVEKANGKITKIEAEQALKTVKEEVAKKTPLKPKVVKEDPLIKEAKKYKSADEFVKAQGEPVYHGGKLSGNIDVSKSNRSLYGKGFNVTDTPSRATQYNENLNEFVMNPKNIVEMRSSMNESFFNKFADKFESTKEYKDLISPDTVGYHDAYEVIKRVSGEDSAAKFFAQNGIDGWRIASPSGISDSTNQITIFNPKILKTKSQLTDIYNQAKGVKEAPLVSKTLKNKETAKVLDSSVDNPSFTNPKDIKVYRGEGKGIGNSTLVNGKYFADSKVFASKFGKVSEDTIPAGSKIFDLDKVKNGQGEISPQMLVDQKALTKHLMDKGFEYTKNTNARGVEYVLLKDTPINELAKIAKDFKTKRDFLEYLAGDGYSKVKDTLSRIRTGDTDLAWNQSRNIGINGEKIKEAPLVSKKKPIVLKHVDEMGNVIKKEGNKKVTVEPLIANPSVPKRIENQTIEKGLVDNFKNIDEYDKVSFKDQAIKVGEIIDEDPERAIRIALGKELPTNGALPESVFIAVKNQALAKGDTDLLIKLATEEGGVAKESTLLGQRIKMLDERKPIDAFSEISKVVKERQKVLDVRNKNKNKIKTEIEKAIHKDKIIKNTPTKYDWNSLVQEIICK